MTETAGKQIICPECNKLFAPADFDRRPVKGYPGIKNVGITCPHCEWFGHLFVEDPRQRRRRATVALRRRDWQRKPTPGKWRDVEKAQADLERVFEEVQAKWRPLLGLTPFVDLSAGAQVDGEGGPGASS